MACRFRGWWPFRVGQRRPVLVRDRADKPAQRPRVRGQQHGGHERGDPTRRPPEATALRPAAANKTVITIRLLAVPSAGSTYDGSLRAPTHNSGSRRTRPSSQRCASPAPRHRGLKDIRSHRPLTPTFSQDQQHPSAAIRAAARSCGAAAHGFVRLHGLAECPHGGGSSVRVAGWPPQRLEANSPTEQQRANSCDHSADTQLGPHRRWEACRVHRVEVPGPEVLGVATVDNGETGPGSSASSMSVMAPATPCPRSCRRTTREASSRLPSGCRRTCAAPTSSPPRSATTNRSQRRLRGLSRASRTSRMMAV